jgi:hypothetical protein
MDRSVTRPSETSSGSAWLANFSQADIPAATLLLDSLRFVDLNTLRNGLVAEVERLRSDKKIGSPALLLPERNLSDLLRDSPASPDTATAYEDFHPGSEISVTPGSEGIVGSIIRDFATAGRKGKSPWIAPDAELEQLRERRCRSVVLVTDYVGTGDQVMKFANAMARSRTVCSWRSLKLLEIHVLAFAASPQALAHIEKAKVVDGVHVIEVAPSLQTAPWSGQARDSVIDLCKRERQGKRPALGYRDSGGLFVTVRGAPNNLPAVFLQESSRWRPLFPNRTVSPQVAEDISGHRPTEELSEQAERLGQVRIGRNERLEYLRPRSRELLRGLLALHRAPRSRTALAAELGVPVAETEALLKTLRRLGLVDKKYRRFKITPGGRREIDAQKRALRRTTVNLAGSDAPYYPHSLK